MNRYRFEMIKKEYDEFHKALMKKGKLPMRSTDKGFWNSSNPEEIFEAFKRIKLNDYSYFLDLGSGDGSVALIASLFTNTIGIEHDKELFNKSVEMQGKLGMDNVEFLNADFFDYDIAKHDIVFISPDKPFYRGLEKKMQKELNGHLLHQGHHFMPSKLRKMDEFMVNGTRFSLFSR